ncbi:MAG: NADPH-dependent F420 reductase [Anaerolineaceae bacterium]
MTYTIGIIGGTGKEGRGLAYRWAKAGHKVIIGSRSEEKALAAVAVVQELLHGTGDLGGMINQDAVAAGDIAVITVPFAAHADTLTALKPYLHDKILIDVVVPLNPPKVTRVSMPAEGSAAQQAQSILGADTQVVAAFQNISYERLLADEEVGCDVLVCGGSKEARKIVIGLVEDTGLTGWDAGVIENAVVVEGLTSVLIGLNIQYRVPSAGIRITGIAK